MRSPRSERVLLASILAVAAACGSAPEAPPPPAASSAAARPRGPKPLADLVVVYAGEPERAESFRTLLAAHVKEVRVEKAEDLATIDLGGADALIVDGSPMSWEDDRPRLNRPPTGHVLDTFSVPTVLVGGTGGKVADAIELKLGWKHG